MVLLRLGVLGLLDERPDRFHRPLSDVGRRARRGRRRLCAPAGRPGAGGVVLRLLGVPVGDPGRGGDAAGGRRGGPHRPQEAAARGGGVHRGGGHHGDVLPGRRPVPAGRGAAGRGQRGGGRRRDALQLLSAADRRARGARRGLLPGLGLRLRRGLHGPRRQPGAVLGARLLRPDPDPGGAHLPGLGRPVVGRLHPGAAAQAARPARGGGGRARDGAAAARLDGAGHAPASADAVLPAGVPGLQRRHPDGDLPGVGLRLPGAGARAVHADRGGAAGPGAGGGGGADDGPAGTDVRCPAHDPRFAGGMDDHAGRRLLPAREGTGLLLRAGRRDRSGPRRQPGAVPVAVLPPGAAGQGGRVLLGVRAQRPGNELAGSAAVRCDLPAHRQLSLGDHLPGGVLRHRLRAAGPGPGAAGDRRGGQPGASEDLARI
ncbi:putative Uncharacterized MFS-type transporter [Streptomyces misionensis JCM 4497]